MFYFRNLEQLLLICRDAGDLSEISKFAHSSCSLYQQHGSPESGATVLDKAGKMLESTDPEGALPLFQRAAEIVMVIKMKKKHVISTAVTKRKSSYQII